MDDLKPLQVEECANTPDQRQILSHPLLLVPDRMNSGTPNRRSWNVRLLSYTPRIWKQELQKIIKKRRLDANWSCTQAQVPSSVLWNVDGGVSAHMRSPYSCMRTSTRREHIHRIERSSFLLTISILLFTKKVVGQKDLHFKMGGGGLSVIKGQTVVSSFAV